MIYRLVVLALFAIVSSTLASAGDRSKYYNDCVTSCEKEVCKRGLHDPFLKAALGLSWSLWSCREDCEYECQWKTVASFQERKWPVPQFYGKWPFIRIFGLQEPASAIFSVCNFLVISTQLLNFRKAVPSNAPYFTLWHFYSAVCLNCWIWSSLYHARDSDLTERLDYISASVMVFVSFYTMTVRALRLRVSNKSVTWSIVCACVVLNHCAYLWFFPFDYSYNMMFNVIVGSVAVAGWLLWAAVAITQGHPCSRTVGAYAVLMAIATLFELFDFSPIWWTFDAHALWHLSTCFIAQLFYSFIQQDCIYLTTLASYKLPTQLKID